MKADILKRVSMSIMPVELCVLLLCVLTWSCATTRMQGDLVSSIHSFTSDHQDKERRTALLLLGTIEVAPSIDESLARQFDTTSPGLDRLLLAYVLYTHTQEEKYAQAFVHEYPLGEKQASIWEFADRGSYVVGPCPLEGMLAYLANTDDEALNKLVSGWPFAKGRHGEALRGHVEELWSQDPGRVKRALVQQGIPYPEMENGGPP
jgi:hypothetical protein